MNDEQMLQEVGSWLKEGDPVPPDAHQSVRQAMARTPQVPQRGRWWPLPILGRTADPPTTDQTTTFQPAPIPATNGHSPTTTGRTLSMFSPAKAITAGALVFAIGSALLIGQPFGQPGDTVPGAVTDDRIATPVEFTGRMNLGSYKQSEIVEVGNGVSTNHGGVRAPAVREMSEPRFDGEVRVFPNSSVYRGGVRISHEVYRIQNDEGAWQSEPAIGVDFAELVDNIPVVSVFHGEGAYEGLTAIVEFRLAGHGWDLKGVIIDGGLPPEPEPAPFE
jgi:hypothetical protein